MNEESKGVIYFEKSTWPIMVWLLAAIMCGSIYLAIWAPLGQLPAILISTFSAIGLFVISRKMQTTIYISNNFLYANEAKIEIKYIKKVTPLNQLEFKRLNGVAADPAAFLATNFWTTTGVQVQLMDKNDPTPYWLISTKRAEELAKKLT